MTDSSTLNKLHSCLPDFHNVQLVEDECASATTPRLSYQVTTHAEQVWFQGHFPGLAILPGVVQLQTLVLHPARACFASLGPLKELSRIKFTRPLIPGDTLAIQLTLNRANNKLSFEISFKEGKSSGHPLSQALPQEASVAARGTFVFSQADAV